MKRKIDNNKGFSLIELLVVVAIMAVALAMISVSVAVVFNNNVRSAANSVDSMLSKAKVNSTYRAPVVFVEIAIDADGRIVGRYYEGYDPAVGGSATSTGTVEVLSKNGNIPVRLEVGGSVARTLSTTQSIVIAVERGTGKMQLGDGDASSGFTFADFASPTNATIILGQAGNIYEVAIAPSTGKHEVRRG